MRKLPLSSTAPRLVTLGAIFTLFLTAAALKAEPLCTQATMNGTYVTSGSGTIGTNNFGTYASAIASVGKVTYDGHGNGQSTSTTSVDGVISRGTATAVYTVNPDCTGSKTFGGPGGTTFDFVITADGREIVWIVTNAGRVVSGRAIRLDNSRN
jgi:hypothetical protein